MIWNDTTERLSIALSVKWEKSNVLEPVIIYTRVMLRPLGYIIYAGVKTRNIPFALFNEYWGNAHPT